MPFSSSRKLIDHAYSAFHAVLHCGNLSSDVQVFPRPEPVVVDEEVEPIPRAVSTGTRHAFAQFNSEGGGDNQLINVIK